jgi:hypothetical protein
MTKEDVQFLVMLVVGFIALMVAIAGLVISAIALA